MNTAPEWLQDYLARGFRLVFYPAKTKHPAGADAVGWTQTPQTPEDYHEGDNVGIVTGIEIQPGRYLVDVDFDWPEGLPLAKRLLPETGFGFGRKSRPISHGFFTISEPCPAVAYDDVDNKPLVELRGAKKDGTIGLQTMVPPSLHPDNEVVTFVTHGEVTHCDELPRRVLLYAIACIVYKHLGLRGFRHDERMCLTGFLLDLGMSEDEIKAIGLAIAEVAGNDVRDYHTAFASTLRRYKLGEPILGKTALAKALGDKGNKVVARIRSWVGDVDFLYDAKGEKILASNQDNVKRAFEKLGVSLSFNEFTHQPMVEFQTYKGALNDAVAHRIRFTIDSKYHFLPAKEFYFDLVYDLTRQQPFHPVRQYFDGLPPWDGTPRVDTWLTAYGGAVNTEYTRAVGSIVLLAAVRRIRQPGCKFDELLVLISAKQGTDKSSAIRALCPNPDWFSDDVPLNMDAKQIIERTGGKWLIEAAELQGFSIREENHLKALLSRQTDGPVRLAYERISIEVPRQFVFIGTTNTHQFLKDKTGNRRFWPVEVEKFKTNNLLLDREQLWAEASARELRGESIRLDPRLYEVAEQQQESRRIDDPWEETIETALAGMGEKDKVPAQTLWMALGTQAHNTDSRHSSRMSAIMQRFGYRQKIKCRPFKGADPCWCWVKGETEGELLDEPVVSKKDDQDM